MGLSEPPTSASVPHRFEAAKTLGRFGRFFFLALRWQRRRLCVTSRRHSTDKTGAPAQHRFYRAQCQRKARSSWRGWNAKLDSRGCALQSRPHHSASPRFLREVRSFSRPSCPALSPTVNACALAASHFEALETRSSHVHS